MSASKISAVDYIALFNKPGTKVSIGKKLEIDEEVIFDASNYNCDYSSATNTIFNNKVTFKNVPLAKGIQFETCEFRKGLIFESTTAVGYDPSVLDFHSITFNKCLVNDYLVFQDCKPERGVKIFDCEISGKTTMTECLISMGAVVFEESKLDKIDFSYLEISGVGLRFESCEVKDFVRFTSLNLNSSISLIKSTFKGSVYIWAGNVNGLTLNKGVYEEDVRFEAVNNKGTFTIYQDKFEKSLQIDNEDKGSNVEGIHNELYLHAASFGTGLIFNGAERMTTKLVVRCSLNLTGTFTFNSTPIQLVEITSDNHKANVVFNYATFRKVSFDHFNNYGNLIFSSCKALDLPDTEFVIYNSNLGKAQFQNFFFNSFKKVAIIDSLVSNIEFSGMHWFDQKVLDAGDTTSPWRRTREVFRQLKQASEKQNDKFQALEFQALELSAYKKEIQQKGKLLSNDGLILWLGQTNDYGLNWRKPMWLLIVISTLLYFPLVISASSKIKWAPACNYSDLKVTLSEFVNFSYIWPQLYNPARTLKHAFQDGVTLNIGVYFWDMVQRIILAFFIVQIVSAFRKYFKS